MKNIQADIKSGNFKQVYLLYGEEAYLKQQYKQNLVKALNPDGDTMNFNHYEGKGIDVKQLIDLCETMPFFAERRVVLLEDTGFGRLYERAAGLSVSGFCRNGSRQEKPHVQSSKSLRKYCGIYQTG